MNENPEPIKIMEYLLESRVNIDHVQNVYDPLLQRCLQGQRCIRRWREKIQNVFDSFCKAAQIGILKDLEGSLRLRLQRQIGLNEMVDILQKE